MKPLLLAAVCAVLLTVACGAANNAAEEPNAGSLGGAGSVAPDTGDDPDSSAALAQTRLVITTDLAIEVDNLDDAYAKAGNLARSFGGYVAEAKLTAGDDASTAFLRLRVPATQHGALLASLDSLAGRVTREQTSTREVTADYTDLQSRLVNLQRGEAQYQDLLARAGTIDDVLKVTSRLNGVRGEIEQTQGRANLLADQSDFATVAVTLSLPAAAPSAGLPSPLDTFANAVEASLTFGHAPLNVTAVLLVAALWLAPALLAFVLLRRPARRLIAASKRLLG